MSADGDALGSVVRLNNLTLSVQLYSATSSLGQLPGIPMVLVTAQLLPTAAPGTTGTVTATAGPAQSPGSTFMATVPPVHIGTRSLETSAICALPAGLKDCPHPLRRKTAANALVRAIHIYCLRIERITNLSRSLVHKSKTSVNRSEISFLCQLAYKMPLRPAPSEIRIPISSVRCATA